MKTLDWKNATPEQINLWNLCNGLIAWTTITPLYYEGAIAGSEFLTYNAGKLYIALDCKITATTIISGGSAFVALYNMANALSIVLYNIFPYWNTTAVDAWYEHNQIESKNFWFSRIVDGGIYNRILFNGYRLNV